MDCRKNSLVSASMSEFFLSLSRIFHSYRDESIGRWGETGVSRETTCYTRKQNLACLTLGQCGAGTSTRPSGEDPKLHNRVCNNLKNGTPWVIKGLTQWHPLFAATPQGVMPILEVDGKLKLSQSTTIARYLARELSKYYYDITINIKMIKTVG